ncbi:MAG: FKBP-type peptidyl-prolyl cis-trans isomerase [Elusimicrobiota bacterium]|jgi:FKBP-type peptidyl-prolyl cis-trans isomerase FkpA
MILSLLLTFLSFPAFAADAVAPTAPISASAQPKSAGSDEEKTLYALGQVLGRNLLQFYLTPQEYAAVEKGITDAALQRPSAVELETYGPKIEPLRKARMKVRADAFLSKAAKEAGAVKTESGLIYKEIKAGKGKSPKAEDKVKVHYHGTLMDGHVFDSSVERKEPAEFTLKGVIPCWTEGVQKMKVGGKARLVCPAEIAYGDRGAPPMIPGGAPLSFEIELLDIVKK